MCEQMAMFPPLGENEDLEDLKRQVKAFEEYDRKKRRWENAFQKWSDEQGMDGAMSYGCCGYGSICDWCEDNTYGRPCVRALNAMCREKHIRINYDDMDFKSVWHM